MRNDVHVLRLVPPTAPPMAMRTRTQMHTRSLVRFHQESARSEVMFVDGLSPEDAAQYFRDRPDAPWRVRLESTKYPPDPKRRGLLGNFMNLFGTTGTLLNFALFDSPRKNFQMLQRHCQS